MNRSFSARLAGWWAGPPWLALAAAAWAVAASGCEDWDRLIGEDERTLRLLLYASPRQTPPGSERLLLVGVEAVVPGGEPPRDPICARLTAQLGSFEPAPEELLPDAGTASCPGSRCAYLRLPPQNPRRTFIVYRSTSDAAQDILLGELYRTETCPPAAPREPDASGFLTLQVPDVPPPQSPRDIGAEDAAGDAMAEPPDAGIDIGNSDQGGQP